MESHDKSETVPGAAMQPQDRAVRFGSVPLLTRRRIEALIVKPLLDAFSEEFGEKRVLEVAQSVIRRIARESGEQLAAEMQDQSLSAFARILEIWQEDGGLEIDMLEQSEDRLFFNVTRCRYAEQYRELGMSEVGTTLSCCRDAEVAIGFNSRIHLDRTQTIMTGGAYCDFRYRLSD